MIVALISVMIIAARLLAISRFDVNTATTILDKAGTATAAAGTALALLPFALVLVTCTLSVVTFIDSDLLDLPKIWLPLLLSLALGATLCLTAVTLSLFTLAVVAVAAIGGWLIKRGGAGLDIRAVLRSSQLLRAQGTLLLVVLALAPIVLQRPWLPMQSVTTRSGRVLVGYVLGESTGQLALMKDTDRTVVFVLASDVKDRQICSGRPSVGGIARSAPQVQFSGSLLGALLWGADVPHYSSCPSPK